MKKIILIFLALIICRVGVYASEADNAITATYSFSEDSVAISGSIGEEKDVPVTVVITQADNPELIADDYLPVATYLIHTLEAGRIDDKKILRNILSSGRYYIYCTCKNGSATGEILVFDDSDSGTLKVLDEVNAQTDSKALADFLKADNNIEKLGIAYLESEKCLSDISSFCISQRLEKQSKFDLDELIDTVKYVLFMCNIRDGASLDDAMSKYASALNGTYSDYDSFSAEVKQEMLSLIKNADYLKKSNVINLSELKLVSEARIASNSWSALRDVLINQENSYKLDVDGGSNYYKIGSDNKHLVFYNMLNNITTVTTIKEISDLFSSKAASVYKDTSSDKSTVSTGGGGGGGGSKTTIAELVIPTTDTDELQIKTPANSSSGSKYTDISEHFSREAVNYLGGKNIIKGYEDNTFKPDNKITRAEFSQIVYGAFSVWQTSSPVYFDDVSSDDWFYEAVKTLSENKIILGYDRNFMPFENISRQDAAVILKRIADISHINLEVADLKFSDATAVSDYAKESVGTLNNAEIIKGDDNYFRPLDTLTRGEATVMIYRFLLMQNTEDVQ